MLLLWYTTRHQKVYISPLVLFIMETKNQTTTKQKDYKKITIRTISHKYDIVQEEKEDSMLFIYDNNECVFILMGSDIRELQQIRDSKKNT